VLLAPLVVVQSYGLMGVIRLKLPPQGMALLEPKPTNAPPDLGLETSFSAFEELADFKTINSRIKHKATTTTCCSTRPMFRRFAKS